MKKALITASLLFASLRLAAGPADIVDNVTVDRFSTERDGSHLSLDLVLGLKDLHVASNQCVLLTPSIVGENDSITLPPIAIYGRRRYYYYQRNNGDDMLHGTDGIAFMAKDKPGEVAYHRLLAYSDWMDGAKVTLKRTDRGCCGKVLMHDYGEMGRHYERFFPELVYITPVGQREKRRSLEGKAYIDFPVDQTVIYPDYRRNTAELAAIRATIDTIRNDRDARIDSVWLKGFASPESPYSHNTDLAKGRTEALKDYINRLYNFDGVIIKTYYEPEDWEGLREAVAGSNLSNRDAIIALIDSDMEPDAKEARIKRLYPSDYKFMLRHFYPALRHTNYKVSYVIRTYSDPAEIMTVMREHPQNLDLNEFYVAANGLEPGSDEFTEVFETAVRMFPDDNTANLNAANAAIRRGDLAAAERYLDKAGDSPETLYARGAIAVRRKDYDTARKYLKAAADAGLSQAGVTLDELDKRTSGR